MREPGPGDLPPDLPPEYAEAYRKAYERAYRQAAGEPVTDDPATTSSPSVGVGTQTFEPQLDDQVAHRISGPLFADEVDGSPAPPSPSGGSHRANTPTVVGGTRGPTYEVPEGDEVDRPETGDRPPWLVPALFAGLVVVLLLAAYGVGRVVASSMADAGGKPKPPDGVVMSEDGSTPSASPQSKPTPKQHKHKKQVASHAKYTGPTRAARIVGASASCESASSVDSSGHRVSYGPSNVFDGDMTTAWRCDGSGAGDTLHVALGGPTRIGEVGLIPGYAKTDPASGADRYRENNRISQVRWRFSDGTTVVQRFDPSPNRRSMQAMRIPTVKATGVTVTVVSTVSGPRDTTAISEVRLGETR